MPQDGKDDDGNPIEHTADNNETLGDALSKAGFEPSKIGRRIVSQGKRRETLRKQAIKKPG
ncbi:hypothetical protein LZK82_09495 [Rhizobium leguminosarum]|nr:hypothetical protein LZK82_09495 [Rhizobium leguminosarum]UIL29462.1 hypothetical protein LZK75_09580 [Rhizobium leguminosarum]